MYCSFKLCTLKKYFDLGRNTRLTSATKSAIKYKDFIISIKINKTTYYSCQAKLKTTLYTMCKNIVISKTIYYSFLFLTIDFIFFKKLKFIYVKAVQFTLLQMS